MIKNRHDSVAVRQATGAMKGPLVYTISNVSQLSTNCDAQLRLAVSVAFAASAAADESSAASPLLLMRLTRNHETSRFRVVGHHLAGADPAAEVSALSPEQCHPSPGEDHLGTLAVTNLPLPSEDVPTDADGRHSLRRGDRIIVGVTLSGWSVAMRERWDGRMPTCQIAEPSEFGKLGDELADALAAFNNRFQHFIA